MGYFACPFCSHPRSTVMCFSDDTKENKVRYEVFRYRKCQKCSINFKTVEKIVPIERKPGLELKKWSETWKGKKSQDVKGVEDGS